MDNSKSAFVLFARDGLLKRPTWFPFSFMTFVELKPAATSFCLILDTSRSLNSYSVTPRALIAPGLSGPCPTSRAILNKALGLAPHESDASALLFESWAKPSVVKKADAMIAWQRF